MTGPLAGVRVLDIGVFGVGPLAATFIARLGADVIRIEPPEWDRLAFLGTMQKGISSQYIAVNHNKRNIILNLKTEEGKETALKLARWADVMIANQRPGALERVGLGYEVVSEMNPGIVYINSSAFGWQGPRANSLGLDPYLQAASGFASLNGKEGEMAELLRFYGHIDLTTSIMICQAALLGLLARKTTGKGQKIETCSLSAAISLQTSRLAEYFATGVSPKPMGSKSPYIVPSRAFRTLDGKYINVSVPKQEFWPKLCRALEIEHLEADPRFSSHRERVKYRDELEAILEEVLADKPTEWWMLALQRQGVPCGYYYEYEDICHDPHNIETKIFQDIETPWGMSRLLDAPWQFSKSPLADLEPTHYPGQDAREILEELDKSVKTSSLSVTPTHAQNKEHLDKQLPLKGIKVVDLTDDMAGAFCSMQLGDAGAEVIKIEKPGGDECRHIGPEIGGESALFLALNRNKKSIVIDYTKEAGRKIVEKLISEADIFIESFIPDEAARLSFSYEDVRRIKFPIIYASITPFGENGPYRNRQASELEIQGMAGYPQFLGKCGEPPVRVGADIANLNTALSAFIGILAALYYRKETGFGQKLDTSMYRTLNTLNPWVTTSYDPDAYAGWNMTGPYDNPEHGYETGTGAIMFGLAIDRRADRVDQIWAEFCKKLDLEGLLQDEYFRKHGMRTVGIGRDAQEMKPVFENAFANWSSDDLVKLIEEVGGAAASVKRYDELFGNTLEPQVSAIDIIEEIEHPVAGKIRVTGIPWKLFETPCRIISPPPTLGQHTDEILQVLGYSQETIAKLKQDNVVT